MILCNIWFLKQFFYLLNEPGKEFLFLRWDKISIERKELKKLVPIDRDEQNKTYKMVRGRKGKSVTLQLNLALSKISRQK